MAKRGRRPGQGPFTGGRKPGQGPFNGGRKKGIPNKKGSMKEQINFKCSAELFQALSLAAVETGEQSANLYARRHLIESHGTYIEQIRDAQTECEPDFTDLE